MIPSILQADQYCDFKFAVCDSGMTVAKLYVQISKQRIRKINIPKIALLVSKNSVKNIEAISKKK